MQSIPLFIGVLVFLAGCSSGPLSTTGTFLPPEHNQKLAQAKSCCSSYREVQYAKLALGQETAAILSPESPVFDFSDGRSFFAAFELPDKSQLVAVKTYPVNMVYNPAGHVLVPAVQFLDAKHQIVETVKPSYLARNPRVIGNSWGEAEVPIPPAARYVILLDGKLSPGLSWRDSDQRSGFLFVRSGPTGELSVLVRGG